MTLLKATVVTKQGKIFETAMDESRQFSASSFADDTLQMFMLTNGNKVMIQGDNVAYVEIPAKYIKE